MKSLGRIVVIGAALLIPAQLEGQPRNGARSKVSVEFNYRSGPGPNAGLACRPARNGRRFRCASPVRGYYGHDPRDRTWVRAQWGEIHLYRPGARFDHVRLGERGLENILGLRTVSRIRRVARRSGFHGRLTGTWSESRRGGSVLDVRMNGRQIAELRDYDRDGYVDDLFLRRSLRY